MGEEMERPGFRYGRECHRHQDHDPADDQDIAWAISINHKRAGIGFEGRLTFTIYLDANQHSLKVVSNNLGCTWQGKAQGGPTCIMIESA